MIGGALLQSGSKVKVPDYQRVDVEKEQKSAIGQNIKALPQAAEMAAKTAKADQDTLTALLRRAIPGYDRMIEQQSNIVQQQMRGELPSDVSAAVLRSGAARALGTGLGGSALGRNLTLRDLGLTSMGMQQQGLENAMNFIQNQRSTGMVNPMSAASMFVTPQQRIALSQQENAALFNRNLMAAQVAAQPDPKMAALGSAMSQIGGMTMGMLTSVGGSMLSGGLGGLGGMMGGGGGGGQPPMVAQFNPPPATGGFYPQGGFQYSINPTAPPNVYANVPGGSGGIPSTGGFYSGGLW